MYNHIAAAVAAHMESAEVVERAAHSLDPMAFKPDDPRWNQNAITAAFFAREQQEARDAARAAIRACFGEGESRG